MFFAALLMLWTLGGMVVGTLFFKEQLNQLRLFIWQDPNDIQSLFALYLMTPALLMWLGGVIMFAALMIASPERR